MFKVKFICETQSWFDSYATISNLKLDTDFYKRNGFNVLTIERIIDKEYKYLIKMEYNKRA